MESLKDNYFFAICKLAESGHCLDEFGISPQLSDALRWYVNGPSNFSHLLHKAFRKAVLDARDVYMST